MAMIDKSMKEEIGRRFKEFRLYLGLTQGEIAALLGITQTTITGIEKGKSLPTVPAILYLMANNNLSPVWLFTGKGEMAEKLDEASDDYDAYKEEAEDLIFHLKRVPAVRDFLLEKFVIFKLQNKKEILEFLENKGDQSK
jgi:transcriptional regulator with XRE-family HTH domain